MVNIKTFIIGKETTDDELEAAMKEFKEILAAGKDVAFVVRKGALSFDGKPSYGNDNIMLREEIIRHIVAVSGSDPIVTTYSDYVLAVLYDKRSCGEMVQLDEVSTDRNGGRRYTNYHYQFNNLYFINLDANTVIFTLGPEPEA